MGTTVEVGHGHPSLLGTCLRLVRRLHAPLRRHRRGAVQSINPGHGDRRVGRSRARRHRRRHQSGNRRLQRDGHWRGRILSRLGAVAGQVQGHCLARRLQGGRRGKPRGGSGGSPWPGPRARSRQRPGDRHGHRRAADAAHRERGDLGHVLERRDQGPAAGGTRPLRARAPRAGGLRSRRARWRRQLRRRAQPARSRWLEQLDLRHREPGAGQRERPARRGEQLPAGWRHGDEPGLGRRRRRHAEPGIGEGDSRHLEQLLGRERRQNRRAGAGGLTKRHQHFPRQPGLQAQHAGPELVPERRLGRSGRRVARTCQPSAQSDRRQLWRATLSQQAVLLLLVRGVKQQAAAADGD